MSTRNWIIALALLCLIPLGMAKDRSLGLERYESVVISFAKGDFILSRAETTRLRTIVQDAQKTGRITKIEIAAWSDEDHPELTSLSKPSTDLALQRIQSIKIVLKKDVASVTPVTAYNMAENSSWLGRLFHSSEAELDAVFAKRETGELEHQDYKIFKRDGAPSKAVVLFKVRE